MDDIVLLSIIAEEKGSTIFGEEIEFTINFPNAPRGFKEEVQEYVREKLERLRQQ